MSYKELLSCLAIIYHGSERERMLRMLIDLKLTNSIIHKNYFSSVLYAILTQAGTLNWYEVETFIRQCGDELSDDSRNIFRQDDFVSQEQFLQWLDKEKEHQIKLINWLDDQQRLRDIQMFAIEKIFDKHSILAGVTHCT